MKNLLIISFDLISVEEPKMPFAVSYLLTALRHAQETGLDIIVSNFRAPDLA